MNEWYGEKEEIIVRMIWGRYDTHMVNSQSEGWGLVKYDMGRYGIQLMSIRKGGKELLPSTQSRTFLPQRKAYYFRSSQG